MGRPQKVRVSAVQPENDSYRLVSLTHGQTAIVDADKFEEITQVPWCAAKDGNGRYYACRGFTIDGVHRVVKMHRILVNAPPGRKWVVDHINGDTLDNRIRNLRICRFRDNICNGKRRINNTSGYIGVSKDSRRGVWNAHIRAMGRRIFLGSFDTRESAARCRDEAALRYHGQFARLNFPSASD